MSNQKKTNTTLRPKPVFAKLTSDMSSEQMFKNLKAALIKSGFTIKDDYKHQN